MDVENTLDKSLSKTTRFKGGFCCLPAERVLNGRSKPERFVRQKHVKLFDGACGRFVNGDDVAHAGGSSAIHTFSRSRTGRVETEPPSVAGTAFAPDSGNALVKGIGYLVAACDYNYDRRPIDQSGDPIARAVDIDETAVR